METSPQSAPYGKKHRIDLIDATRGVCILLMVAYHMGVDLVMFRIIPEAVVYNPTLDFLELSFALLFILMSGVSSRLSRNNLKRGLMIFAAGMAVTLATWLFNPGAYVRFGILHFLGAAALLFWALRPLLDRIPRFVQPIIYIALYLVTKPLVYDHTYPVDFLFFLGFRSPSFGSTDYFPILPYIFVYFLGAWLGTFIAAGRFPAWFYRFRCRPLAFIGKNTMWVYLIHQPVNIAVAYLILFIQGRL